MKAKRGLQLDEDYEHYEDLEEKPKRGVFRGSLIPDEKLAEAPQPKGTRSIFLRFALLAFGLVTVLYIGTNLDGDNPQQIPEHEPPVIAVPEPVDIQLFDNLEWLSQSETASLRERVNVVNLAWLMPNGSARYNSSSSLPLTNDWEISQPFGYKVIEGNGDHVVVEIDGTRFYLNRYQPFVYSQRPGLVCAVDEGDLWCLAAAEISKLEALENVINLLEEQIAPNPELSLNY